MQLNIEQKKLIQAKPSGHSLIRGVAGSGKTTVAVHRASFLLNNYCVELDDKILILTYNKTLVNYIKHIYKKLEDSSEYVTLFTLDHEAVDICTIDKILDGYFWRYKKKNKFSYEVTTDGNLLRNTLSQCIIEISKLYPKVNIMDGKNLKFLMDEIEWIKSSNYMELEEYQNADRIGRMSGNNSDDNHKLMKNSLVRSAIYQLMELYDERLKKQGFVDFKTKSLLALSEAKNSIINKYTHIIVDECQDLTRVQLEIIRLLLRDKPYSSVVFAADTAQSIYTHGWLMKGRSFTSIGYDMTGKSNVLAKNYRTTTQIAEAAYSLLEKEEEIVDDDNFVKPSLIDKQGYYPIYRRFINEKEESNYIANEIKRLISKNYSYRDIVILAKKNNQLTTAKDNLCYMGIPSIILNKNDADFEGDSVKLLTIHSMKGLEAKVVFIIGINEGVIPFTYNKEAEDAKLQETIERKLLYVGMTRANELLYLTASGNPSRFINDINSSFLRVKPNCSFGKYYSIPVDDYLFRDKIADIYSREEAVRQFVLKELINKYKYPKELITIEHRVNSFSKVGLADIVVSIYHNSTPVPFIIFEVKSYGAGVNGAEAQLKSYMSNMKTCKYGVAFDGNDLLIINNNFEEIEDIPAFNSSMLPASLENYAYTDLKRNRKFSLVKDSSIPYNLQVKDEVATGEYDKEGLKSLNIYSDIAAGLPIYMSGDTNGTFELPKEWFNNAEESFILKIKGNSMINAGINNGDYVVIEKRPTVDNMQIAAVSIDDSATLKRIMKMGDSILLISENSDYEPIQLSADQVRVIGVAVGVISKT